MSGFWDVVALAKGALAGRADAEQQQYQRQQIAKDDARQERAMTLQEATAQFQRQMAEREAAWREGETDRIAKAKHDQLVDFVSRLTGKTGIIGPEGKEVPYAALTDPELWVAASPKMKEPGSSTSATIGGQSYQSNVPSEAETVNTAGARQEIAQRGQLFPTQKAMGEVDLRGKQLDLDTRIQLSPLEIRQAQLANRGAEINIDDAIERLASLRATRPSADNAAIAQNEATSTWAGPMAAANYQRTAADADFAEGSVPYKLGALQGEAEMSQLEPVLAAAKAEVEARNVAIRAQVAQTSRDRLAFDRQKDAASKQAGGGKDYTPAVAALRTLTADIERGRYNGKALYDIAKQAQNEIVRLSKVGALPPDTLTTMLDRIERGLGEKPTSSANRPSVRTPAERGGSNRPLGQPRPGQPFRP